MSAAELGQRYAAVVTQLIADIGASQESQIEAAAALIADQVMADRLVHVYGPGGHSNLASQEVFFRAGGLMHVAAILDEGTLLSGGALRSMAMERLPGYGRVVIDDHRLGPRDLLILVNAYGINAALIDAALRGRELGARLIGVSSRQHAEQTAAEHPARHPSKANLHDVVDVHIDTMVPIGDASIVLDGVSEKVGAVSTFANAYALNWLMLTAVERLVELDVDPPVWRSGNAPGGDEANAQKLAQFAARIQAL